MAERRRHYNVRVCRWRVVRDVRLYTTVTAEARVDTERGEKSGETKPASSELAEKTIRRNSNIHYFLCV